MTETAPWPPMLMPSGAYRRAEEIADGGGGPRPLPPFGAPDALSFPRTVERRPRGGPRIVTVPVSGASTVEVRVQLPFVASGPEETALAELLSAVLFAGTARLGDREVSWDTALATGRFQTARTTEWLILAGHCEAAEMPALLGLLAERLRRPHYAEERVRQEVRRIAEAAGILRAQPRRTVLRALNQGRYGRLGCFDELPSADVVHRLTAQDVREAHERILVPDRADVLIVGDIEGDTEGEAAADAVQRALADWSGRPAAPPRPPVREDRPERGRRALVHRPDAVQAHIAMSLPALGPQDPRYPAQAVANAVFGGYFSSRLVTDIREREGLTYHAQSRFERTLGEMSIVVEAVCATAAAEQVVARTEAAMRRLITEPPDEREVDGARRFLSGSLLMATASQSDLANLISSLSCWGIDLDWIESYPRALLEVTPADVAAVAAEIFGAGPSHGVVVGDVDALSRPLAPFGYRPTPRTPAPEGEEL
ncbi:M16 family metallopeptidase [Streptomyces sp. NPDC059850]|uniref:M16 family metallopeptidase n=1 Tax=Streptomyces sp. NPDC059850 TaxID=3346970 RepID=UPI003663FA5C